MKKSQICESTASWSPGNTADRSGPKLWRSQTKVMRKNLKINPAWSSRHETTAAFYHPTFQTTPSIQFCYGFWKQIASHVSVTYLTQEPLCHGVVQKEKYEAKMSSQTVKVAFCHIRRCVLVKTTAWRFSEHKWFIPGKLNTNTSPTFKIYIWKNSWNYNLYPTLQLYARNY